MQSPPTFTGYAVRVMIVPGRSARLNLTEYDAPTC